MVPTLPIQLVDLNRQYRALQPEMDVAILRAVSRGDFILGEETREFEREFAAFIKVPFCVGVANGTDALHLALIALGIGAGDEVIVPTNTFVASALAISQSGARPVLVDCDPDYFTLSVLSVERALTARTKAIMPVHLYGHPADMDPLLQIAKDRKLFVIEDAAQAHGAAYKKRFCGTIGHVGCFSFYPGKNLGAYGDGGAIVTSKSKLAERLSLLRNLGQKVKYVHTVKGFNSRLDTVQAAILRVKLCHLKQWNNQRRAAAARYSQLLAGTNLRLPKVAPWANPVWHLYVAQTTERTRIENALNTANIAHGIHYPIPIHLQKAYRDLGYREGYFPVAERLGTTDHLAPDVSGNYREGAAASCHRIRSTGRSLRRSKSEAIGEIKRLGVRAQLFP